MSFTWPVGKLDLINRALALTGNNVCAQLEDGSDEYAVASPAYEDGLACMIEDHGWGFATKVGTLTASPTAPADTAWDTAYPLPADLVHIIWVRLNRNGGAPTIAVTPQAALYDILAGQLVINAQGGPPPPVPAQTPGEVTMKYISNDNADPISATPRFVRALTAFVLSGIYRGLMGDASQADHQFAAAEQLAQMARTRHDQGKPKRQLWNSRVTASRRMRRPWPPRGNNSWGGSGVSG